MLKMAPPAGGPFFREPKMVESPEGGANDFEPEDAPALPFFDDAFRKAGLVDGARRSRPASRSFHMR